MLILCIWLHVINKVKVTHQDEGHIKVKVKIFLPFRFYVKFYLFRHINPLCVATNHSQPCKLCEVKEKIRNIYKH